MAKKMKFRPGDTVRVVGERGTSTIRSLLTAMNGALLETEIGGFRSWNIDELRLVQRAKPAANGRGKSEAARARLKAVAIARWSKLRSQKNQRAPAHSD